MKAAWTCWSRPGSPARVERPSRRWRRPAPDGEPRPHGGGDHRRRCCAGSRAASPQVAAGTEGATSLVGADKSVLHQIIGPGLVARQGSRIAAQGAEQTDDVHALGVVHAGYTKLAAALIPVPVRFSAFACAGSVTRAAPGAGTGLKARGHRNGKGLKQDDTLRQGARRRGDRGGIDHRTVRPDGAEGGADLPAGDRDGAIQAVELAAARRSGTPSPEDAGVASQPACVTASLLSPTPLFASSLRGGGEARHRKWVTPKPRCF